MPNYIGTHGFLFLHGDPVPPSEQIEVQRRLGIDGLGFWLTGKVGPQFTMRSVVDCVDLADARETFQQYLTLKELDPLPMIQDDHASEAEPSNPYRVKVIDVRQISCRACKQIVGGLYVGAGEDGYRLECEWVLVAQSSELGT